VRLLCFNVGNIVYKWALFLRRTCNGKVVLRHSDEFTRNWPKSGEDLKINVVVVTVISVPNVEFVLFCFGSITHANLFSRSLHLIGEARPRARRVSEWRCCWPTVAFARSCKESVLNARACTPTALQFLKLFFCVRHNRGIYGTWIKTDTSVEFYNSELELELELTQTHMKRKPISAACRSVCDSRKFKSQTGRVLDKREFGAFEPP